MSVMDKKDADILAAYNKGLMDGQKLLQAELEKYRWIPVSERLPENGELCLWIPKNALSTRDIGLFVYFTKKKAEFVREFEHWQHIILPKQALKGK